MKTSVLKNNVCVEAWCHELKESQTLGNVRIFWKNKGGAQGGKAGLTRRKGMQVLLGAHQPQASPVTSFNLSFIMISQISLLKKKFFFLLSKVADILKVSGK